MATVSRHGDDADELVQSRKRYAVRKSHYVVAERVRHLRLLRRHCYLARTVVLRRISTITKRYDTCNERKNAG